MLQSTVTRRCICKNIHYTTFALETSSGNWTYIRQPKIKKWKLSSGEQQDLWLVTIATLQDLQPCIGNPPTQKTASQGNNDVPHTLSVSGSHTSNYRVLLQPTRGHRYRYRVPYSRIKIHKESFFLSGIRETVEPATRRADSCWIPGSLQGRDFSRHTTLDFKMFLSCF